MIKDALLKIVFIPVLGVCLPLLAGLMTYELYSPLELAGGIAFFIFTSWVIWTGCNWIHRQLRPLYAPLSGILSRITSVSLVSALYGACTGGISSFAWVKISRENFAWSSIYKFVAVCIAAVILFTLVYEIIFLSKERELDHKVVNQLDRERSQAELQALSNEMDPHFLFNALNTLNYLILHNPEQAHLFNNRLAQVYKYFLINKNRELISLEEEMEFINSYFYLLQIRHDEKLQMEINVDKNLGEAKLPPCALQILVENAIKHNEFTDRSPLQIRIGVSEHSVNVSNNIKPKPYMVSSTGIGLKNLSARYRIIARKNIEIERGRDHFTVRIPLLT